MPRNPDAEAYRFLYEQARRSLDSQEARLDELRTRTGVLIAVGSVVAAFLAPQAASDGLGLAGVVGIAAFLVASGIWFVVLWPYHRWTFENDVGDLFADFVETDPPLTLDDIHRELAIHHDTHIRTNEAWLNSLYLVFQGGIVALIAEVALFMADLPR